MNLCESCAVGGQQSLGCTVALPRAEGGLWPRTRSSSEHGVHSLQTGVWPALTQRRARISHLSQHWCSGCTGEVLGQRMAESRPPEWHRDGRASTREKCRQGGRWQPAWAVFGAAQCAHGPIDFYSKLFTKTHVLLFCSLGS